MMRGGLMGLEAAACQSSPCLGNFCTLHMRILGCVHGKAWAPIPALNSWFARARVSPCVYLISPVFVSPTGLILLFYLVFYGFLAALFTFTMWAMLQTLNDEIPKYRDQITSPGNGVDIIIAFKHHSIWLNLGSGM